MKVSSLYIIFLLFFIGCNHTQQLNEEKTEFDFYEPPPPPPLVLPPSLAPDFIPSSTHLAEIQINEIPHPFNLNGHIPCQVWVNGKRLNIKPEEAQRLAKAIDLEDRPKIAPSMIHAGAGWTKPLSIKE
jgi:hypothetical protein